MNPDRLVADAKEFALELARDYAPPPRAQVKVGGEAVFALLKLGIWSYRQGGYISDYDVTVLGKGGACDFRRQTHGRADGSRTIYFGSGARGFLEFVRQRQDAGADSTYAQNRQAAEELIECQKPLLSIACARPWARPAGAR